MSTVVMYDVRYGVRARSVAGWWILVAFSLAASFGLKRDTGAAEARLNLFLTAITVVAVIRTTALRGASLRVTESELTVPRPFLRRPPLVIPIASIHRVERRSTPLQGWPYIAISYRGGVIYLHKAEFKDAKAFSWLFDYLSWRIAQRAVEANAGLRTVQSL